MPDRSGAQERRAAAARQRIRPFRIGAREAGGIVVEPDERAGKRFARLAVDHATAVPRRRFERHLERHRPGGCTQPRVGAAAIPSLDGGTQFATAGDADGQHPLVVRTADPKRLDRHGRASNRLTVRAAYEQRARTGAVAADVDRPLARGTDVDEITAECGQFEQLSLRPR